MIIKRKTGLRSGRAFAALFAIGLMFAAIVLPAMNASASERIAVNGIDADPDVGEHNSYGWCAAVFEQDDGEYLWVGTNRDAGASIMTIANAVPGQEVDPRLYDMLGIPQRDADQAGKIYRLNLNDPDAGWELMYENRAFSGYRKMIVFNGELFVFAGVTNRGDTSVVATGYQYSAVYRFSPDFQKGDTPDVVLWERLPAITATSAVVEYYRAATVYEGKMYVGTFDCKIYCTDGTNLTKTSLNPRNGVLPGAGFAECPGWTLAANLKPLLDPETPDAAIWDITGFNGSLYVSVTGTGFRMYKMDPDGQNIIQTVGNRPEALYPPGMGIVQHVAATPCVSKEFGYMYVSTFAFGTNFMIQAAGGNIEKSFGDLFCPAAIYRFDTNDKWEVVVGDPGQAVDKDQKALDHVGNMRAGFYIGTSEINPSPSQYIWQMAEYGGRLYATTWDIGVFRDAIPFMLMNIFLKEFGDANAAAIAPFVSDVFTNLSLLANASDGYSDTANIIQPIMSSYFQQLQDATRSADRQEMITALNGMLNEISAAAAASNAGAGDQLSAFADSLNALLNALDFDDPALESAIKKTTDAYNACAPFLLDRSDPPGFDIFYTEDGVNWYPYTVNGLGDPNNYGGRVLLPSEYGLFLTTANPFTGCQVWLLDVPGTPAKSIPGKTPVVHGITSDVPTEITVIAAGDSVTFYVSSVGLRPNDIKVTLSDGTVADVKIEVVEVMDGIPTDYWSKVDIVEAPFSYAKWAYVEESGDSHPVHLYEVTIKGLKGYKGTLGVTIEIDGVQHSTSFDIRIVGNDGSDFMTAFMILLAISLVVCFVALRFTRPGH